MIRNENSQRSINDNEGHIDKMIFRYKLMPYNSEQIRIHLINNDNNTILNLSFGKILFWETNKEVCYEFIEIK